MRWDEQKGRCIAIAKNGRKGKRTYLKRGWFATTNGLWYIDCAMRVTNREFEYCFAQFAYAMWS